MSAHPCLDAVTSVHLGTGGNRSALLTYSMSGSQMFSLDAGAKVCLRVLGVGAGRAKIGQHL